MVKKLPVKEISANATHTERIFPQKSVNFLWFLNKLCSISQISDDRDHKTVLYREECVGPHFTVWIIVFYTFHSLLLIFGLFLAFETRKVSIPALNDSRLIGISVYNVVLLCAVGVPVSFFTNSHPTVSFSLICAVILFCTTLTLGILFVPKVRTFMTRIILSIRIFIVLIWMNGWFTK